MCVPVSNPLSPFLQSLWRDAPSPTNACLPPEPSCPERCLSHSFIHSVIHSFLLPHQHSYWASSVCRALGLVLELKGTDAQFLPSGNPEWSRGTLGSSVTSDVCLGQAGSWATAAYQCFLYIPLKLYDKPMLLL